MVKKKRSEISGLLKTSIGGMAGLGALGTMNQIPGMPTNNISGLAATGVNLAQLGHVARIGMNIMPRKGRGKHK